MKIAVDLSNGSATSCAVDTLRDLGARCKVIHSTPDGLNINTKCGSTHPESLQELMRTGEYAVGFAFDGDNILHACGKYYSKVGKLKNNTVVTTVMANLGLYKALDKANLKYAKTAVGDKYVFECMEKEDYSIGGEQSGHIIFRDHANTGDGLLTALKLLEIMMHEKKSLKQLNL